MKKCPYAVREITTDPESGRKQYVFPDGRRAITGTDVSHYVGKVDWKLVKEDGIAFVMIRIGWRDSYNGEILQDKRCHEYFEGAQNAGIPVGAYFFSTAINSDEIMEETASIIETLEKYEIRWPVVLDVEMPRPGSRAVMLKPSMRTDMALIFQREICRAGYQPMLYCNSIPAIQGLFELHRLEDLPKWIAEYRFKPYYPYEFAMWQYSCTASVAGINAEADLDLSFIDYGS